MAKAVQKHGIDIGWSWGHGECSGDGTKALAQTHGDLNMTTLACRNLAQGCLDTFSADDSTEIQKVFLNHVHAKHPQQWSQLTQQYKAVSLVTIRNRFRTEAAEDLKNGLPPARNPGSPK